MNTIESAAVIGAGALGLLYADRIQSSIVEKCFFIAGPERAESINKSRFFVNDSECWFKAVIPDELNGGRAVKPDLIIVAVKNYSLHQILPILKAAVKDGTAVLSVLNGIDSEEIIEKELPEASVIRTVAVGMDAVKSGLKLNYTTPGKLIIGMPEHSRRTSVLSSAAEFLNTCGIATEIQDDILRSLWWKWMINIGVNQVSAVTGAKYGIFHSEREIQLLMEAAMRETVNVAIAFGVNLHEDDISGWYSILNTLGPDNKTSMLQDMEAGRRTEVDSFSGKLIELADKLGIDVPVNRTLYRIIKMKELVSGAVK